LRISYPSVSRFEVRFMPAAPFRLSGRGKASLFVMPFLLLVGAIGGGAWLTGKLPNDSAGPYGAYLDKYNPNSAGESTPDGAALYAHHCANCHGINGDGNGITPLSPKARYFAYEKFKFTDTLNATKSGGGIPTDATLLAVLTRGIPGSPMPSFARLGRKNLEAVVEHLRTQFIRPDVVLQRIKKKLMTDAEKSGDEWDEKSDWSEKKQAQHRVTARAEVEVGVPLAVPDPFPDATAEALDRGRKAFDTLGCTKCHGPQGRGDGEQTKDPKFVNDNGTRAYPRDLTAGVYKGGGEPHDLFRRVYLGIPGTPMPANGVTAQRQDLIDVVHYVRSLPDPTTAAAQSTSEQKIAVK
jgi:mono/diheme cytochrome c family protein